MDINNLYISGISKGKFSFLINPVRRILFRFLRPYFTVFLNSSESLKAKHMDMDAITSRLTSIEQALVESHKTTEIHKDYKANQMDIDAITSRLTTIEKMLVDRHKNTQATKEYVDTQ